MKLHVLSDLHIEFGAFEAPETDADVIVLAGDIGTGLNGLSYAASGFGGRPVIYVAGNHEYYGHALPHLTHKLREAARGTPVHFLDERGAVLDGVRFLGATLWTDFELFGRERAAMAMEAAGAMMNDYERIRKSPQFRRLEPADTRALHHRARAWLRDALLEPFDGPTVVVTHHAPTMRSCSADYVNDVLTSAFISNLDWMMGGATARLWIHGHTHHGVDLDVGGTRVLSNQRGYPGEPGTGFRPDLVVEVR